MISSEFSPHQNAKNISKAYASTPIGVLAISVCENKIISLSQVKKVYREVILASDLKAIRAAQQQLAAYFAGSLKIFKLPLAIRGTEFQKLVWAEMAKIPYGKTKTYGDLASAIGRPRAARAIGQACNRNPHFIFVPCHRVVAAKGLGGFALGLKKKMRLLNHETHLSHFDTI